MRWSSAWSRRRRRGADPSPSRPSTMEGAPLRKEDSNRGRSLRTSGHDRGSADEGRVAAREWWRGEALRRRPPLRAWHHADCAYWALSRPGEFPIGSRKSGARIAAGRGLPHVGLLHRGSSRCFGGWRRAPAPLGLGKPLAFAPRRRDEGSHELRDPLPAATGAAGAALRPAPLPAQVCPSGEVFRCRPLLRPGPFAGAENRT
jgi:hypothetical protein